MLKISKIERHMAKISENNLKGRQKGKNDLPKLKAKHTFHF